MFDSTVRTLIIVMFGYLVVGDVMNRIIMFAFDIHHSVTCVVEEDKK